MTEENGHLDPLLEYIRDSRGFDFTGYKRASLKRRIDKRLEAVGVETYEAYLDKLQADPAEFKSLFDFILINVTGFFRDPPVWDYLRAEILPAVSRDRDPGQPIRAWCAGSASGEEAYTIAMLLAEQLGISEFRERVKIYATDVDEAALDQGRRGAYGRKALEAVPPEYRARYFEANGEVLSFRRDMRRSLIFGRHDLVQDAPISRTDLILCRNTLMYMNSDVQSKIMAQFMFSLRPGGFLVLGKSEMLFTRVNSLTPVNLKARVFRKGSDGALPPHATALPTAMTDEMEDAALGAAFEENPAGEVVVAADGNIRYANRSARKLLGIAQSDVGRPLQDLELSYRPVELRSLMDETRQTGRAAERRGVIVRTEAGSATLNVIVAPLYNQGQSMGFVITYTDISEFQDLKQELENSNQELETAMEELQSSNEELETTNEELQSTNEELETTNEELQSTNEELETMNEELQSTNEELQTVNQQLHERNAEVDHLNQFMTGILSGMRAGVAVLGRDLRVEVWNKSCEDLWGLRADEVSGQPFLNLDLGLPLQEMSDFLRSFMSGEGTAAIDVKAMNRRGQTIGCRVSASLLEPDGSGQNVLLLMEELPIEELEI